MDYLINNLPFTVGLWAAIYAADFLLTMTSARLYARRGKEHIVYAQGIELTPYYKQDVARQRWISPRFILAFGLTCLLLWLAGLFFRSTPVFFEILLGAWFLLEAAILSRHLRNLFVFAYMQQPGSVSGQIHYAMWFTYRNSSADLLAYALLYLFLYLIFGRGFFLGGLLSTAGAAVFHWILGNRSRRLSQSSTPRTEAGS